jgi:uncharacterized membrane protein
VRDVSSINLIWNYLSNPHALAKIFWASFSSPELIDSYSKSFIGVLGWLNVPLPEMSYTLLWIGLIAIAVINFSNWIRIKGGDSIAQLLLVVLAFCSIFLIFFAMLISWTPTNSSVIQGVQGRYFSIPSLMLAYSLASCRESANKKCLDLSKFVVSCFVAISLWSTYHALWARYV